MENRRAVIMAMDFRCLLHLLFPFSPTGRWSGGRTGSEQNGRSDLTVQSQMSLGFSDETKRQAIYKYIYVGSSQDYMLTVVSMLMVNSCRLSDITTYTAQTLGEKKKKKIYLDLGLGLALRVGFRIKIRFISGVP